MNTATSPRRSLGSSVDQIPAVGLREYWYPIIESKRVTSGPVPVRVLGEDLVLFRGKQGTVAALADRCPHRGARLSLGRVLFPGTLSCGYHGWTFDERGQCLAAIVEGPESKIAGKASVNAYKTEERLGLVWAYIGSADPPPLEEQVPVFLFNSGKPHLFVDEWDCNWRLVSDNFADMCHAILVHRTSLLMLPRRLPAWAGMQVERLPDGSGHRLRAAASGGAVAEYPGVGKFPRRRWWRVTSGHSRSTPTAELRLPGYIVVHAQEGLFDVQHVNLAWPVPIDAQRTRYVNVVTTYPKSLLDQIGLGLWWHAYYRPLHVRFVHQDRRLLQSQDYRAPEKLSALDVGVIQWRQLARAAVHRAEAEPAETPNRTFMS
jgi:phenylpropionate dioxygenase-like ring-hydroxylating dioxygenase large terminal subunit